MHITQHTFGDPEPPKRIVRVREHACTLKAVRGIDPRTATNNLERVETALREAGKHGATDDELSHVLVLPGNSVRPRRLDLVKRQVAFDSGRTRKNAFGNVCTVWVHKDHA